MDSLARTFILEVLTNDRHDHMLRTPAESGSHDPVGGDVTIGLTVLLQHSPNCA